MRSRLRAIVLATRSYCSGCFRACGSGSSASQRARSRCPGPKDRSRPALPSASTARPRAGHLLPVQRREDRRNRVARGGGEVEESAEASGSRQATAEILDRATEVSLGVVQTMGSSLGLGPLFVPSRPKSRKRVMRQWEIQHRRNRSARRTTPTPWLRRRGRTCGGSRYSGRRRYQPGSTRSASGCWTVRPRLPRRRATQN